METIDKPNVVEPSLTTIVSAIQSVTGVDIRVGTRRREIVWLKKIYYKIAHELTLNSAERTAQYVKTKNHATALHHRKTADHLLATEPKYKQFYDDVMELLAIECETDVFQGKNEVHHVKKEIVIQKVFVDKVVDYYDTGIPDYIIDHLKGMSEEDLENLYQTRIIPFSKMIQLAK